MGFMDKLKDAANSAKTAAESAAAAAKEKVEQAQAAAAEKKALEEAHKAEMQQLVGEKRAAIINAIEENYSDDLDGFFNGKEKGAIFKYSKDFFEKILLPANSRDKTYLAMYPHINSKIATKLMDTFHDSIAYDSMLIYISDNAKQEFLLTYDKFYFKTTLEEDKKYFVTGSVPTSKVSLFSMVKDGDAYNFMCDDVKVGRILINDGKEADFITLNKLFEDMKNNDFDITEDEIEENIKKKIGSITYTEVRNELDDEEKIIFFSWDSDHGYVACSTEKMILASKTSGGNVSNVSRYYYDEIGRVETRQQATDLGGPTVSDSLGGMLLEMAVTAAAESALDSLMKDVCDLVVNTNMGIKVMPGMTKIEADKIVGIYNQKKKELRDTAREEKKQAATPQVIVQQATASQPDVLEQLQKLAALKDAGILSEEEFAAKKADLLAKL